MTDCWCDYEPARFYCATVRRARKSHTCEECGATIAPGDYYEHVAGMWDFISVFKTCQSCRDLRMWTQNNVPCLCWQHGNANEDCLTAIKDACERAPEETIGLRFGFLRRKLMLDRRVRRQREEVKNEK